MLAVVLLLPVSFAGERSEALAQHVNKAGDGTARRFYPDDPLWVDTDTCDIPPPATFELHKSYDYFQNTFRTPGSPHGPSLNVNTLDEVPNSSWFTNRLGQHDMTIEELLRGPDVVDGPAPGTWTVTGRPWSGITPKFTIRDSRGDTYLIKLDPLDLWELPSSVEMISTKIFHALGYNVPSDYLVNVDRSLLEIEPGATYRASGGKKPIKPADLDHWLRRQVRNPDGTIRALASKYIPGRPVGEFKYYGVRSDDPNDIFPHDRRRELRGLRVFAAWLNHDDSRALNTFDTYVEENGSRFIRHYLLDFGSNMGSGSTSAQQPRAGNEYYFEKTKIVKGIFSLGLWSRDWMHVKYPGYPAVGNFEGDFFEPAKWKPQYPHPAFSRMDAADAFWAARILSRLTDDMIRAVVKVGHISDPEAESYLTEVILKRKHKCVNYWITRTSPLDNFAVGRAAGGGTKLTFDNAAVRVGAARPGARYSVQWSALDNLANKEQPVGAVVTLDGPAAFVPDAAWGPVDDAGDRYAVAAVDAIHPDFTHWQRPVHVTLRERSGQLAVVGIVRPREDPGESAPAGVQ
ncbi:MAG: hypothetical protein ACE5EO_01060 [Candidatus Krumholzibacteriia bacterium]